MPRWPFILLSVCVCATAGAGREDADSVYLLRSHACRFHLFPEEAAIRCRDTMLVTRSGSVREALEMRLWRGFSIDTCLVDGRAHSIDRSDDRFVINDLPSSETIRIIVTYAARTNAGSEFSRLTKDRAIFRLEEFLPSLPGTSPRPLRSLNVTVIVPAEWQVTAPGDTVMESLAGGERTARFSLNTPIPAMGWICAGTYVAQAEDSISVFLFPDDSSSSANVMDEARRVLRFYSERFRPYRFSRLSIVECEDWVAGPGVLAIAMPTMIMVKQRALHAEGRFDRVEAILPHEIAHQWWTMTVFVGEDDNALLSEGMCEYSAFIYGELTGRTSARDSLQHHPLLRPLMFRVQEKKDTPLRRKADLRSEPTQYLKALYVQHMLRRILGDSAAFALYREWCATYFLRYGTQDDFQALAERISGKHLGWFFDQWTGSKGIPRLRIYNVKAEQRDSAWITRGRVRLIGYDRYAVPIDVAVLAGSGVQRQSVWVGTDSAGVFHNDVGFEITTDVKPSRAILDPSGDVLKVQKIAVRLSDLREPSDVVLIVGSGQAAGYLRALAEGDSALMDQGGWSVEIVADTGVTLGTLQRDHVVLYGLAGDNSVVNNLESHFPMHIRHDSVMVGGEGLSDSSLTLIQAIENTYTPGGMMVWVAPLSRKAHPSLLPYESSWILLREKEEIASGTWDVRDEDLSVEIR